MSQWLGWAVVRRRMQSVRLLSLIDGNNQECDWHDAYEVDAIQLLKQRAAAGEPIVIPRQATSSTSTSVSASASSDSDTLSLSSRSNSSLTPSGKIEKWDKLKKIGGKSLSILETSRQIAAGEKEMKVAFLTPGSNMVTLAVLLSSLLELITQGWIG